MHIWDLSPGTLLFPASRAGLRFTSRRRIGTWFWQDEPDSQPRRGNPTDGELSETLIIKKRKMSSSAGASSLISRATRAGEGQREEQHPLQEGTGSPQRSPRCCFLHRIRTRQKNLPRWATFVKVY